MNSAQYPELLPHRKPFKRAINQIVLFVLGRAVQSLSRYEPRIRHEVASWPENFTLMLVVRPKGGSLALRRTPQATLHYLGRSFDPNQADVVIYMKDIESAFAMFTGQLGIDMGYARHCMCASGDLSNTVSVVRVLNTAVAYLFPAFIARRLMKRLPPTPFWQKQARRLRTYLLGIPFGI